jgi:hypothetical protein
VAALAPARSGIKGSPAFRDRVFLHHRDLPNRRPRDRGQQRHNNNPSGTFLCMDHPPPHSFSRSPVEEVFCRCTCGSESHSLAILPPYPGWPDIRDRIREMIAGIGEISRVTGCLLRYTDLLPVGEGTTPPETEEIARLLSGRFDCSTTQDEIILTGTRIPGTGGSVCSIHNRPRKPGWTLVFTLHTEGPAGFLSADSVVGWFDDARAEIHELFDLIVPGEIVQTLR